MLSLHRFILKGLLMAKFSLYNVSLRSLSQGVHHFDYDLDNKFFEAIDGDEVRKGSVHVELTINKTSSTHEMTFVLTGVVQIPCNRCLDEMNQEIDSENRLIVKLGHEYSEESDEVVIIPEDEGEINIAWYLYEFIALNIPIKHVHAPGECNKAMSSKFRQHRAVNADDEEYDDFEDGADDDNFSEDNQESATDPRWDALKGFNADDN